MAVDLLKQIEKKLTQLENKNELKDYLLIASRNLEHEEREEVKSKLLSCLLYTSPSPRDGLLSRMPSSA